MSNSNVKLTKSAFIRQFPELTPEDVVRMGQECGYKFNAAFVHVIRHNIRKKAGMQSRKYTKSPAVPVNNTNSTNNIPHKDVFQAVKILRSAGVKLRRSDVRRQLASIKRNQAQLNTQAATLNALMN